MRIVFGHNNFLIRKFKPSDLGMPDGDATGMTFEVRQHYGHLFWIPFLSIGKIYILRKAGDPNLYVMPDSIKALIRDRHQVRTPWYTFAGPLLILAGFLIYGMNEKLNDLKWSDHQRDEALERKGYIQYPTTGDYYDITLTDKDGSYSSQQTMYLKVRSYNDDNIEFISLYPSLSDKPDYSTDLSRAIEAFDTAARFAYHPVTIPKATLLQTVDTVNHTTPAPVFIEELRSYCQLSDMERRKLK